MSAWGMCESKVEWLLIELGDGSFAFQPSRLILMNFKCP